MFSTNIRLFLSKKSTCNHRFVDIGIDNQLEIPSYLIPCHSFCHLVCHLGHSQVCLCHLQSMLLCRNGINRIFILRENIVLFNYNRNSQNDMLSLPASFSQAAVHFIAHPSSVVLIFFNVLSTSNCPRSTSKEYVCKQTFYSSLICLVFVSDTG